MKLQDCILISMAASTTLFTVYVLGGGGGESVPGPPPAQEGPSFAWIVVHGDPACASCKPEGCHFMIGADGGVQSTVRFRNREALRSTGREDVDPQAVVVALEPAGNRVAQHKAFQELVCRLSSEHPSVAGRIRVHAQFQATRCGLASPAP